MDEVVLTTANNLSYRIGHRIRLVAEHQVHLFSIFIQIIHYVGHIAQPREVIPKVLRHMVFEIPLNDITRGKILSQTVVDGLQVHSCAHKDSVPLHGTATAMPFDPETTAETRKNQSHDDEDGDKPPRHAIGNVIRLYTVNQDFTDVDSRHEDSAPKRPGSDLVQTDGTVLGDRVTEKDGDEIGHVEEKPVQGDARHPAEVDAYTE